MGASTTFSSSSSGLTSVFLAGFVSFLLVLVAFAIAFVPSLPPHSSERAAGAELESWSRRFFLVLDEAAVDDVAMMGRTEAPIINLPRLLSISHGDSTTFPSSPRSLSQTPPSFLVVPRRSLPFPCLSTPPSSTKRHLPNLNAASPSLHHSLRGRRCCQ
jgi:hypothetical protein